jgi:hypothetical protein
MAKFAFGQSWFIWALMFSDKKTRINIKGSLFNIMQELVFNLNTRNDCVAIHYFGLKIRSLSGMSKKIAAFNKRVLAMSAGFFSDFKVYPTCNAFACSILQSDSFDLSLGIRALNAG